jgi:DNA-binding NtrC family response regulator
MCGRAKRILVIDDEERVLFIWREALKGLNDDYDIVTASTAAKARDSIREGSFDLVITDLRLPSGSGVQLTELIRTLGSDIPVIWMTAYGCYRVTDEAQRLSVFRCLDKPVEVDQIRQIVREALDEERDREPQP